LQSDEGKIDESGVYAEQALIALILGMLLHVNHHTVARGLRVCFAIHPNPSTAGDNPVYLQAFVTERCIGIGLRLTRTSVGRLEGKIATKQKSFGHVVRRYFGHSTCPKLAEAFARIVNVSENGRGLLKCTSSRLCRTSSLPLAQAIM
jgi:hypothetical protein